MWIHYASIIIVMTLLPLPASAVDLSGKWVGKFVCFYNNGSKDKYLQQDQTLLITQVGANLSVNWNGNRFTGHVINDDNKPNTKGQVALADCLTSPNLNASYAELANLKAKVNRDKGKGSLKGWSIYSTTSPEVGECKWLFKLVDTSNPEVGSGCP